MVVTRRSTSESIRHSTFILTWSGTKRGQGRYVCEYISKNKRGVYAHSKNKDYVMWYHHSEWLFARRSELNKRDPGLFAWCADRGRTPLDIKNTWKILDRSAFQWIDCLEFNITPVLGNGESTEESSDKDKEYYSHNMSPEELSRVSKEIEPLKKIVSRNAIEIKNLKSRKGSIKDPWHISDLEPLEKRLYKLEKEELEWTSKLVKRVETAYSVVKGICKQSKNSLKKEELRVLKEWDLLKYTTQKQLKEFLREKRRENYFIRGYGYIKLSGTKETIAKRVKRVLDQMEQDGDLIERSPVKTSNTNENGANKLGMSPKRKRRKVSSPGRP